MPAYKLTYFNHKAKAEPIRFAFHLLGVDFQDIRLTTEQWLQFKPDTPQGHMPILEIDQEIIPQTNAILKYIAREYDLYGAGNMQNTRVDVVLHTVEDIFEILNHVFFEKDEQRKEWLKEEFKKKSFDKYCKIFCKILEKNGTGWLVGSNITIADLVVYNIFEYIQDLVASGGDVENGFLKDQPQLLAHRQKMRELPKLMKYLSERPVTEL